MRGGTLAVWGVPKERLTNEAITDKVTGESRKFRYCKENSGIPVAVPWDSKV
jgi:hypothetical protein